MRYVAAYCLAALGGSSEPTAKDIEKILGSVGVDCDAANAKIVIDQLKGKNLEEVIEEGKGKLGTMPSGGAAPAAGAATAGGAAPAAAAAPEKKVEEPEEESDEDMGFGLFD